ncbi:MAG TPA: phosphate acyltransferase [Opitutaceae bacterium]|jgi:phosphate acetyltransferase|nr:phosphate acyltransferase [Opitutaceae bacterium]
MPLVPKLIERLQRHPKRVVFPEGSDPRIIQAARQWVTRRMGVPILLGDRTAIKSAAAKLDINLEGMRLIEPERSEDFAAFATEFTKLRRDKGLTPDEARAAMRDTNYFATMMLATARVDALVAGATVTASSALRPLFQIIPRLENVRVASSLMILDFDENKVGSDGSLFLADCSVIPDPTAEQLCDIALSTAMIAHHLTNETPRIAMLSYASKSSSSQPSLVKVRTATELARAKAATGRLPIEIDGELQLDAALDARTAEMKKIASPVAGRANILIFPDLNSANIGYKLVQILAGANTFGQILTGLSKPAAEISRGASAHDIFGAAAVVGCQAIDRRLLYGTA